MKEKLATISMMIMILTSTISTAFIIRQSSAYNNKNNILNEDVIEEAEKVTVTSEAVGSSRHGGFDNSWLNIFERKPYDKQESDSQTSGEDKWNSNDTSEWSNFIYLVGNKTRLIVGVNGEGTASLAMLEKIAEKHQAIIVNTIMIKGEVTAVVVELPLMSVTAFVENTRIMELASYIEPNMRVQTQLAPSDPYWTHQWGSQKIEADWAWNTTVGSYDILVAVVDTGIDYTHPDLAANYVALGYDWVNNDDDPMDDHGHGTHCAGIIAAILNNNIGIAGLAQVRIMAEKVLDSGGWGYWDWVANGIIHATDSGADIISMSLGGRAHSDLVREAVKYAYDSGVLVIASAGNDDTNMKSYPAGYDEVIAIAATDRYDNKAWFSNWGDWIELSAPGVDIYSTVPWGYTSWSGTSMACPHVVGVAALVWSHYPNKTRDWVRLWLQYTADDLGDSGFDVYYGYGRVNARKAVEETPPAHELIAYEWTTPPYVEPGAVGTINATVLNFGENDETNITVQLITNGTIVDSMLINSLANGNSITVSFAWNPMVEGLYNVTFYVAPVPGETNLENNMRWTYIFVGFPVKAVVLQSAGNVIGDIITNWQVLNNDWYQFGDSMVYIDYVTLNKGDITYEDVAATEADVLIISCAYDPYAGWEFTDSEIEAITRYVYEGHGLIVTAGTLYHWAPNNNKLAPLLGLNENITWYSTGTDLLDLVNATHPLFTNVPTPLIFPRVGTALPSDGQWDSNELADGEYLALGHYQESAIVVRRGLVYLSPWLEVIPPHYHHHLQLLYNAITWSRYQKPEHELVVSLEAPKYLQPGESVLLNATVHNMGLNNETDVELYLLIDGETANSTTIPELLVGTSHKINYLWTPNAEEIYNITVYSPPLPYEETIVNNQISKFVEVFRMVIAVVLDSFGTDYAMGTFWNYLNTNWARYGDLRVMIDYTSLNKEHITLADIEATHADVLIISNAWSNTYTHGWEFTDSEIDAIKTYVLRGHGIIATSGTFDTWSAPNNQKLAELFGMDPDIWYNWGFNGEQKDTNGIFNLLTPRHDELWHNIPDPYLSSPQPTLNPIPSSDWTIQGITAGWIEALSTDHYASVITNVGIHKAVYFTCFLEGIGQYEENNRQLFYNALIWTHLPPQEHDLAVSLTVPTSLELGNSTMLSATVRNIGLTNETDVELHLLVNGAVVGYVMIPELHIGESYTINYLWTPTETGNYNITVHAPPAPEEEYTANNIVTRMVGVFFYTRLYLPHEWVGGGDPMGWHADDGSWQYTLPFDFPLYGVNYRTIYVSSNGLITFISPDTSCGNSIPGLAGKLAIAPAWDDWVTHAPNDIYIWKNSTHVGIQWYVHAYGSSVVANFEAILCINGIIQFNYAYNDGPISATIGISNSAGHIIAEDVTNLNYINTIVFTPFQPEHDLAVQLEAPNFLIPSNSVALNATVFNQGLSNETSVELQLLINGSVVESEVIPELPTGASHTLTYLWTPTEEGIYNITAYAPPVENETSTANNIATKFAKVMYPLIHPIEGQYANYTMYKVDPSTGEKIFGGLWNFTYLRYTSPYQINITVWMKDPYNYTQTGWMIVNIFTRMVESDSGIGWTGMWYPGWIETNVTIGSTINLLWSIVTITDSAVILVNGVPIDCWEIELEEYGWVYRFWYDKASGLWIGMEVTSPDFSVYLILTATSVPIGFMYEHDLAVMLDAPARLSPDTSAILNATVYNTGLSNETEVTLQLLINGTTVASEVIPELASGGFYTLSYTWTPPAEAVYNVTVYAPPLIGEEYLENNVKTRMVNVQLVTVALISDHSQLTAITYILDSMGVNYDIYNDNRVYFYTADLNLLLSYRTVIFNNHDRAITTSEQAALNTYLSSGGNLIVTGYDSLGHPDDSRLADVVRSSTVGDNVGRSDLYVSAATHPMMNGPYGSFPAGYYITGLYSDCDRAKADVARGAVTVAELRDGYDKILATEALPGKVVYWNGRGDYDWTWNLDCQAMFKNLIYWMAVKPEHDLAVALETPSSLTLGQTTILNATVYNRGLNNETDVELQLIIDNVIVHTEQIPELLTDAAYTLSYLWTPTVEGIYNVTAYAPPLPREEFTANNVATKTVYVEKATTVYVSPSFINVTAGETFTVNVNVADIADLFGYEFKLFYSREVLKCVNVVLPPGHFLEPEDPNNLFIVKLEYNNAYNATHGRVWVAILLLAPELPKTGSGTLININFQAVSIGESSLNLFDTKFANLRAEPIPHIALDGYVIVGEPEALRDVALTSVSTSLSEAYEGWIIQIFVTAANLGEVSETFDVTVYYDDNVVGTQTVTGLAPTEETMLTFDWNTSGVELYINYTIWAEATTVPGEIDLDNNVFINGTVIIKMLGDVNGDKTVDIFDLTAIAVSLGTQPGDPLWDSTADLNQDSIIDIYDVVITLLNLGIEY